MHIDAIRKFIADHPHVKSEHLTTSQCNRTIVKSESAGTGKPYIGKYESLKASDGKPMVALATVFVSHAWQYPFYDVVVDVMEQHAKDHPKILTGSVRHSEMGSGTLEKYCLLYHHGMTQYL